MLLRILSWFLTVATSAGLFVVAWFALLPGANDLVMSLRSDVVAALSPDITTGALPAPEPARPPSPVVSAVRKQLPAFSQHADRDDLAAATAFYQNRSGPPLWVTQDGLSNRGRQVVAELRNADDWGLRSGDFAVPRLAAAPLAQDAQAQAEIEVTLALLKYARHARGGRIANPARISRLFDVKPPLRDPRRVLEDIAVAKAPDAYLRALHPKHEQFEMLRQLLVKLRKGGSAGDAIAFGEGLQSTATGLRAAPRRVSAAAAADIDRILVNMERWRWLPADPGSLYVWNNVPEFLSRVVKDGNVINSDRIVAGQPAWPTPVFSAAMKTIVFHPSWGVPDGIKRKELAPLLRKSSSGGLIGLFTGTYSSREVLEAHKLEVYYKGRPIDPNQVDWSSVNISAYDFRQPPGPTNVLGTVKFLFPNKHDVYMHDTPERGLFARDFRGLSHGCMRVGDPRGLAAVLLAEDKGWSQQKVAGLFAGGTLQVQLDKHIPVHNTYFTAMVDFKGTLRTFGDLYGLDASVGRALLGRNVRFKTRSYDGEVATIQTEERQRQPRPAGAAPTLADAIADIFSP